MALATYCCTIIAGAGAFILVMMPHHKMGYSLSDGRADSFVEWPLRLLGMRDPDASQWFGIPGHRESRPSIASRSVATRFTDSFSRHIEWWAALKDTPRTADAWDPVWVLFQDLFLRTLIHAFHAFINRHSRLGVAPPLLVAVAASTSCQRLVDKHC